MSTNKLLSITIPTFNRAPHLDYFLETHIPNLQKNNISVYISDNASTDNTKEIVQKWQTIYPNLNYHRNTENLGMDGNFEVALSLPSTDYIWLFGDTYRLPTNAIENALDLITGAVKYDALIFNLEHLLECPDSDYKDQNKMLIDLVPIMSCVACMIYSKQIIASADFSRYKGTFFSLTAIIFEFIANKQFTIFWSKNISIKNLGLQTKEKKNWSNTSKWIEIGVYGWISFLFSLPASYTLESKFRSLRSFGKVSGLLNYKSLLLRRIEGNLNLRSLITHKREFYLCTGFTKTLFTFLACLTPTLLIRGLYRIKKIF